MKKVIAGTDIGGTNTEIGLVDYDGKICERLTISSKGYESFEDFIDFLSEKILDSVDGGGYDLTGIGVGAANGNFFKGTIEYAANLEWEGVLPVADLLSKKTGVPVKVTNDANAAASGEKIYGKASGIDDFVMITLGTGLGSGIFAGGKLLYGHDGFAGELGHVRVKDDGRECGCGRKGCLETYVSATGLLRTAKEILSETDEYSLMRNADLKNMQSKDVYKFAVGGDPAALRAFDFTAEILGKALADFTAVLNPEYFFFFGGLANAGDLLLKPAEKYMNDNLMTVYKNKVKLAVSGLKPGEAAILGASALMHE
ncbi:MAG: ROK family protein [Chlorobi bacterium]|nr:ROK family protein [Chlorobiota bacterium]